MRLSYHLTVLSHSILCLIRGIRVAIVSLNLNFLGLILKMEGNNDPYYIPDMTYPLSHESFMNPDQFIHGINMLKDDMQGRLPVWTLQNTQNDSGNIRLY
jgi:hypothetical protein